MRNRLVSLVLIIGYCSGFYWSNISVRGNWCILDMVYDGYSHILRRLRGLDIGTLPAGRGVCVMWGPLGEVLGDQGQHWTVSLVYIKEPTVISDCTSGLAVSKRIIRGMKKDEIIG